MTLHRCEIVIGCFRAASKAEIALFITPRLPGAVEPARIGIWRKPVRQVPRSTGTSADAHGARLPVLLTHKRDSSRVLARKKFLRRSWALLIERANVSTRA